MKKLNNTKQQNFKIWAEYIEEIEVTIEKLHVVKNFSQQEKISKKEETIRMELHKEMEYYLLNKGIEDIEEISSILKKLEKLVLRNETKNLYNEENHKLSWEKGFRQTEKFCQIHNSSSHSTEECYKNKEKAKNKDKPTKKINAIKEVRSTKGGLEVQGFLGKAKNPIRTILDTGAENVILLKIW